MADFGLTANSTVFSGKEFKVYVGADYSDGTNDVGTVNDASDGVSKYRLDVEGITIPTFSPNQEFEMRSGSGRVAEFGQVFSSSKRTMTEISLSGRVTLQDLPILMENVLTQAATTNDNLFEIASGYNPLNFKHGDATGVDVWNKSLTLYFEAPTTSDSYRFAGCVCTSLNLSADLGTAGGRYDYSATFQTQYLPTKGALGVTSAKELTTSLGSTNVFLSDQTTVDMNIMAVDGNNETSIAPLFKSVNLTIESPTQFLGAQGTNAEPQVFARAVPELNITFGGSIKYDVETDNLLEAFRDTAQTSYIQLILNNRAITSDLETLGSIAIPASTAQLFGFIIPQAKLTSCEVSSDDVASINFEAKVLDPASNKVFHVATGATA